MPLVLLLIACSDSSEILTREPLEHLTWGLKLEPPVPLPVPSPDARVEVWLGLAGPAELQIGPGALPELVYPPGSRADRVELREGPDGPRVIDVRGTTFDADGRAWHHVFQPVSRDPQQALVGVRWPAGDLDAREEAVDAFVAALDAAGRKGLDGVRAKLDCEGCHTPGRPANTRPREHGLVSRGTDSAGFFTPSTLLSDHAPAELYGTHPAPPSVRWTCGATVPAGTRTCEDGRLATLVFDATSDDPHARSVAATRRALGLEAHP